jgi:hypothetical protein
MDDNTGEKKAPPGEEELAPVTQMSLGNPNALKRNTKVIGNGPSKADVDPKTDENTSHTNHVEPPAVNASACSDCEAGLKSYPTTGVSTDATNLGEALAENASASPDLKAGLETDITKCESTNSENIGEVPAENASPRLHLKTELETAPDVNLEQSPKEDSANSQAEYSGPPRQGKEGLQHAIENLMAMETEGSSDHSLESQATSSYEEDHHLQIPDWQDDDSDSVDSDTNAIVDQRIASEENELATGHDWQKEDYITREEWSDKA